PEIIVSPCYDSYDRGLFYGENESESDDGAPASARCFYFAFAVAPTQAHQRPYHIHRLRARNPLSDIVSSAPNRPGLRTHHSLLSLQVVAQALYCWTRNRSFLQQ